MSYANMIFAFVISFIFTFATTPLVRRFAYKIGAVDIPKDKRRVHKRPTPRIGGLAIIFGFIVAILSLNDIWTKEMISILIGAGILGVLGVIDDCKELDAKLKFVVQIAAALIVVLYGDIRISVISNPNVFSQSPFVVLAPWLSIMVSVLWIVFMTNAVNFIDGLDGLAAGVSAIMSMSLVFIAITYHEYEIALLGLALMGACFGFLPFNFNPAKIFMGDTGSMFLGGMVVALAFGTGRPVLLLLIGITYLCEALSDIVQVVYYKLTKKRFFKMAPIHHHFEKCGWSEHKVVLVFSLFTLIGCVLAALAIILD